MEHLACVANSLFPFAQLSLSDRIESDHAHDSAEPAWASPCHAATSKGAYAVQTVEDRLTDKQLTVLFGPDDDRVQLSWSTIRQGSADRKADGRSVRARGLRRGRRHSSAASGTESGTETQDGGLMNV